MDSSKSDDLCHCAFAEIEKDCDAFVTTSPCLYNYFADQLCIVGSKANDLTLYSPSVRRIVKVFQCAVAHEVLPRWLIDNVVIMKTH